VGAVAFVGNLDQQVFRRAVAVPLGVPLPDLLAHGRKPLLAIHALVNLRDDIGREVYLSALVWGHGVTGVRSWLLLQRQ